MSCKPDFSGLVSEIEWLVKDHSKCILECHERLKPSATRVTTCKNECYTMKITLDIFVKLHQMLHNYIGLLNFHGSKKRDFGCLKIPLNEALDVAVRTMISAMQASVPKQPSFTPICLNCTQTSECSRRQSLNMGTKCEVDKLLEMDEVDKKLQRLKVMTLESVDNVEAYIKEILLAITKLPLNVMTSRLEILSSVVRNTKNKLTSCGRPSAASLMGTQVNPISQIISEFILEYGQTKSQIYPCRKICRFCGSVICPMDRERNVFCCENAKHLNFLWEEWIQQNSVKGVAKWDENTIMSIVDSVKDTPVEGKTFHSGGPFATSNKTGGQRDSMTGGQDGEGDNEKNLRGYAKKRSERGNKVSSDFSQGGNQALVDNRLETRGRSKIGHLGSGERRDSKDQGKDNRFTANQRQDKSRIRGPNSHGSNLPSAGERGISKSFDVEKTSRKKGLKKDAGGVDLNDQDDSLVVGGRKKGARIGRGDPKEPEDDLDPENKRRGKSQRKKRGRGVNNPGEFFDDSGDQGIGNTGETSRVESSKKGRAAVKNVKNVNKDGQGLIDVTSHETAGNENDAKESIGSERGGSVKNGGGISPGTKTRENYGGVADGKRNSEEGREVKSGNGTREDCKNIIRYELSNDLFVKLGWTLLPKDTIMRRVVQFQALLAKPHMNWLQNNRIHGKQYYTDEKTIFLNFLKDGSGQVYYPNGQTAIVAQISKKGTHELYKVYAPGGRDIMGVIRQPWLMGVFDSMGNGVVYDESCNVRLTYNQNGGIYADNPSKVPFSWGWNNFQTFPIDEAVYEEPSADHLPPELMPAKEVNNTSSKASKQSKSSRVMSSEKSSEDKVVSDSQKSKTFEPVKVIPRRVITPLKPICLKMNKYLSLRILDRKNINLQFFAGPRCIRIELGTEVNPNVQINSELVDRDDWAAKMTKSRFHVDVNTTDLTPFSPDSSLIEITKEFQRAKNEANSRQLMIAKYRPHLIPSSSHPPLT